MGRLLTPEQEMIFEKVQSVFPDPMPMIQKILLCSKIEELLEQQREKVKEAQFKISIEGFDTILNKCQGWSGALVDDIKSLCNAYTDQLNSKEPDSDKQEINSVEGAEIYFKNNGVDFNSYVERGFKEISTIQPQEEDKSCSKCKTRLKYPKDRLNCPICKTPFEEQPTEQEEEKPKLKEWRDWIDTLKLRLHTEYGFLEDAADSIDESAYKCYYDDGYTIDGAINADMQEI